MYCKCTKIKKRKHILPPFFYCLLSNVKNFHHYAFAFTWRVVRLP